MVNSQAFDIEGQAQTYLNSIQESSKASDDQQIKITIVDWLLDYIGKADNTYKLVPTDLGVTEPVVMRIWRSTIACNLERESNLKTRLPVTR